MKPHLFILGALVALPILAQAEIGVISCADAKALIENLNPAKRPIVLDTRGGYKDYFRAHLRRGAVELVAGSGHLPMVEQSALVAARISKFLQEV